MKEEFIKLIESIGFKYKYGYYNYKEFEIYLYNDSYVLHNGFGFNQERIISSYCDLRPIEKYFKKEFRSFKLKLLLR